MSFWKQIFSLAFFYDPMDVGNLISGSSAFSKSSLNIWKFSVHVLLKPGLENFEHYFASMWDECNCAVVWTFFGAAFLWDWNENWPFSVLWPLLSFPNLLAALSQHHLSGFDSSSLTFMFYTQQFSHSKPVDVKKRKRCTYFLQAKRLYARMCVCMRVFPHK